jgi:tetratricopeptide (TPR) repeat protein
MVGLGDDLDLPAAAADLPAAAPRAAGRPPPVPRSVPSPSAAQGADWPASRPAAKPAASAPVAGPADLPAAKADLPAAKGGPPRPAPPVPRAAPKPVAPISAGADLPAARGADLPAPAAKGPIPAKPSPSLDDPFGRVSAPELPAVRPPAASLPPALGGIDAEPSKAGRPVAPSLELDADLPVPAADLPAAKGTGGGAGPIDFDLDLPSVGASLPAPADPSQKAPAIDDLGFGEIDLPTASPGLSADASDLPIRAADPLPAVASALPVVASTLPSVANALPSAVPPKVTEELDFGELDLGGPGPSAPPAAPADFADLGLVGLSNPPQAMPAPAPAGTRAPADSFGEVDLLGAPPPAAADPFGIAGVVSAPAAAPPLPPPQQDSRHDGGMGFGEVDLGGGGSEALAAEIPTEAPLPASGAGEGIELPQAPPEAAIAPAAVEAALPTATTAAKGRQRATTTRASRGRWVALGLIGAVLVGGGALQLTSYGAFGYLAIADAVRAGEYARATTDASAAARTKMASDNYGDARAALDELALAQKRAPRARNLGAYAALVTYGYELRFGREPDRDARAAQWLAEVEKTDAKYVPIAVAARQAVAGDLQNARKGLDAASKRDPADPIQLEVALLRGEVELAARDGASATNAFKAALAKGGARAQFGLARASVLVGDTEAAMAALEATLAASPEHHGAHLLRAKLRWERKGDEKAALEDVAHVVDGPSKDGASPGDRADAFALRGWIHVARGRAGDARAAFDEALKSNPRHVGALLGQGEVLYGEGRYTEALSRFDTAVQTEPTNVRAIVSSAKAKLALERLADAKTQLTAARSTYPKEMTVAYWLGRTEEALGNRKAAEQLYVAATDLVTPTDREAILPYVALANLLSADGRAREAEAKLEDAKTRLPDSAAMQRAFGEVAASQGRWDDAVRYYQAAIERDPQDVSTRFRLGSTYRRMRKTHLAAQELDKVLASDKDYPGLALERGLLYEESGEVEKALEQFKNALAKAPDDADLQLRVGAAYVAIQRPDDAVPMLRKVLDKRGNSAEANHYLGRALFLQGGPAEAEAMRYLKRAVELDPHRAEYHLYVGWAANNANPAQLGLARDEIEKALAIDQLLAEAYWQRGVLLRKEGAVDSAIKDLRRALELRPSRIEAHAALAECFEDKNDTAAAVAEWQRAIAANDRVPAWRFRYGRLIADKNPAEAAKHLVYAADEADKLDPRPGWYATAEFEAAETLRKTGRKEEAKKHYKRFLAVAPVSSPDRKDAMRALRQMGEEYAP